MHKTLFAGFVVAFVALHMYLKQRGPAQPVAVGTSVAPLFDGVRDPGAAEVLRIAREHRVTVITFFETWCGPCKLELPQLGLLYKQREKDGLGVVGIYGSSSSDIAGFAESLDVSFPLVADETGALARAYDVEAVPTSVVVDSNLQVLTSARGFRPSFVLEVGELLDGKQAP